MSFEFTLLDALQALRCPVLDALAVFFDQAGARGEIWIAFTAVLLAFRRRRRRFWLRWGSRRPALTI